MVPSGPIQTHDLTLSGNVAHDVGPSGKAWRFLVMSGSGVGDVVANNDVRDVGPRDTDTIPSANAPETILTESYRLRFEGYPSAISSDGLILQIPPPQGDLGRTGDVVAILGGPDAGHFRRISQAIDGQTYLMDAPLPPGSYADLDRHRLRRRDIPGQHASTIGAARSPTRSSWRATTSDRTSSATP